MKNSIFICLICASLISCLSVDNIVGEPPVQVRKVLKEIICNPEKIYNLKRYFPEYIHSKYYNSNILDSNLVVGFVETIKAEFSNIEYSTLFSWDSKSEVPMIFSDYHRDQILSTLPKDNIFKSCLVKIKDHASLTIVWIKINEQYYIYDVWGSVGESYH